MLQALGHGPVAAILTHGGRDGDIGEHLEKVGQRVVPLAPTVIDQIEADLSLLIGDANQRGDLAGMHDRGIESSFDTFVEEHTVEHVASCRRQTKAHIGHAQSRVTAGDLGLDASNRFDGVKGVAAQVVIARRQRERQSVEDQIARIESVTLGSDVMESVSDLHLPFDVSRLAAFVDEETDHGGAVIASQGEHSVHSGSLGVAVFEIRRIENGSAAEVFERRFENLGFGRVENQRNADLSGESLGEFVHVLRSITSDVVDAQVQDMGPFADLIVGHLDAGVPVGCEHGFTEGFGAVGVGAFADDQKRVVLGERDGAVERGDTGLHHGGSAWRFEMADRLDDLAKMLRCGAAAPADDSDSEFGHVMMMELGEFGGGQVVVGRAIHNAGESSVGKHADRNRAVMGEMTKVFLHLGGTRCAVDANDIGAQTGDRRERRPDLGSHEHAACGFHRDLNLDGNVSTFGAHRPPASGHGGFDLEQIHTGLDQKQIASTHDQSAGLNLVGVTEFGEADVTQARQLRAGPDRSGYEPGASVTGVVVTHVTCQLRGGHVQLVGPFRNGVLDENRCERPESRGFDCVHPHRQERVVHGTDHIGTGGDEQFVAAFEVGSAEIVGSESEVLHKGAKGAVEHDHPLIEGAEVSRGRHGYS